MSCTPAELKPSVLYTCVVALDEHGVTLMALEVGRDFAVGAEITDAFEGETMADALAMAREYGTVKRFWPTPDRVKGPNVQALSEAAALLIRVREQPITVCAEFLAMQAQVSELASKVTALMANVDLMKDEAKNAEAALLLELDRQGRIVASYEDIIRRREWLAEQRGSAE